MVPIGAATKRRAGWADKLIHYFDGEDLSTGHIDATWLLPPSVQDFVPDGHPGASDARDRGRGRCEGHGLLRSEPWTAAVRLAWPISRPRTCRTKTACCR